MAMKEDAKKEIKNIVNDFRENYDFHEKHS